MTYLFGIIRELSFIGTTLNYIKISSLFILALFFLVIAIQITFAQSPVPANAKLEKLKTGLTQAEGPVWIDSLGLLFSNIQANKICRVLTC